MCVLYLMLVDTLISILHDLYMFFGSTAACNPAYLPVQLDSFIFFVDRFATSQIWVYPLICFFWPTKASKQREYDYKSEIERLDASLGTIVEVNSDSQDSHFVYKD